MSESWQVEYQVDDADVIESVNDGWDAFARENDAAELTGARVVGTRLWGHISDPATAHVYMGLLERVRGGAGPVAFAFRCDSPSLRRVLEMRLESDGSGRVRFLVRPVGVGSRSKAQLLDVNSPRIGERMRICSWCKRIPDAAGRWLEVEDAVVEFNLLMDGALPELTHGICPECYDRAMDMLETVPGGGAAGGREEARDPGSKSPGRTADELRWRFGA